MSHTVIRTMKASDSFLATLPEAFDATNGFDSWVVREQGKVVEKWIVRDKRKTSFVVEVTYYKEDENDPYS